MSPRVLVIEDNALNLKLVRDVLQHAGYDVVEAATGELDNTARLRHAKRELARALTVARERGVDPNVKAEADNG